MIAALCGAIAVVALSAAVRPRPLPRSPTPAGPQPSGSRGLPFVPLRRPRRHAVEASDVAEWCESLARVVRSGSTMVAAVRSVEPPLSCRPDIDGIVLALDRGVRLSEALAVSSDSSHLALALAVLRACAINGGPPAEPLDRAASTLRSRAADAAERTTQSAQARLSAVVMTVLPLAMLALLLATSPTTRSAALTSTGMVAILIGGALNLLGWRWMRRIVAQVAS